MFAATSRSPVHAAARFRGSCAEGVRRNNENGEGKEAVASVSREREWRVEEGGNVRVENKYLANKEHGKGEKAVKFV